MSRALITATLLMLSSPCAADEVRYEDFRVLGGLVLNGAASVTDDGALRLTPDDFGQVGSAFLDCPFALTPETLLESRFRVQIGGAQGTRGADGLVFVLQASEEGAASIGADGGALGVAGLRPSVAVELDTWLNATDPDDGHIAILLDGARLPELTVDAPVDLNDGAAYDVLVRIDGPAQRLSVHIGPAEDAGLDPPRVLALSLDVGGALGGRALLGFSAATGSWRNHHDVLRWRVTATAQPDADGDGLRDPCDPDADSDADGVPDPEDLCPYTPDPDQLDADGDHLGDACDPRDDNLIPDPRRETSARPARPSAPIVRGGTFGEASPRPEGVTPTPGTFHGPAQAAPPSAPETGSPTRPPSPAAPPPPESEAPDRARGAGPTEGPAVEPTRRAPLRSDEGDRRSASKAEPRGEAEEGAPMALYALLGLLALGLMALVARSWRAFSR